MKVVVHNILATYDDQGNRQYPVMLLLHGWGADLNTFDPLIEDLTKTYRVIRLNLPGFGHTEFPGGDWYLADYVDFIDAFIKKMDTHVDILVGHSFGGRVIIKGLSVGKFHPNRVILIASAGIAKRKSLRNGIMMIIAKTGKAITAIPPFSLLRENLHKNLYKNLGSDYGDAGMMRQTFLNVIREDLSNAARTITVPTLLIWGDRDTATPLVDGKRLFHLIPRAKLEIIAGAGHFVYREESRKVVEVMRSFLSSC